MRVNSVKASIGYFIETYIHEHNDEVFQASDFDDIIKDDVSTDAVWHCLNRLAKSNKIATVKLGAKERYYGSTKAIKELEKKIREEIK